MTDEVAYTLQARLFAAGMRVGPPADNASMWLMPFWNNEGPMFSPFPPGWPALLAVGELFNGAAWVNPLIATLIPLVVYRVAVCVSDASVARVAALLAAFSPGILILAGSRMSHTSVLVALGIVMAASLGDQWLRWGLGGLAAGYVVLARPFDAALLAAPLLLYGLPRARREGAMGWWLAPAGFGAIVILVDNALLTGSPWTFPMSAWYDAWQERPGCNGLGFGAEIGCAPTLGSLGHTPSKAIRLAGEAMVRLDRQLLGIHGGLIMAVVGLIKLRDRRLVAWMGLVVLGYALYWSPGRAYGARFYHPLYLVLPILMAVPLARARLLWTTLGVASVCTWGLSRSLPDLADRYWCVDDGLAELLREANVREGVVFVRGEGHRATGWPSLGVDGFRCDPMLEAGDGWGLADPSTMAGGLQIRHALPDRASTEAFMKAHHPGVEAWLVLHDISEDRRELRALGILAPR